MVVADVGGGGLAAPAGYAVPQREVLPPREIVIVLGMHRSGTSLLANILHLLGVDMLRSTVRASPANPTGFWEREDIVAIHEEVLATLGRPIGRASHSLPFPPGWWRDLRLKDAKARLSALLRAQLAEVEGPWGFKDPRTCRLVPLWREVLEELGLAPRFVWAIRHPAEAARSMMLKNPRQRPLSLEQSEGMWLGYNYDVARHVGADEQPVIVAYDQWFTDPLGTAERLAERLGLRWRGASDELADTLAALISTEHRHHDSSATGTRAGVPLCDALYERLREAADTGEPPRLQGLMSGMRSIFGTVQPFAELADRVEPLSAEVKRLAARGTRSHALLAARREQRSAERAAAAAAAAAAMTEEARLNQKVSNERDARVQTDRALAAEQARSEQLTAAEAALRRSLRQAEAERAARDAELDEQRQQLAHAREQEAALRSGLLSAEQSREMVAAALAKAERQAALATEEGARAREAVGRLQAEARALNDRLASATADVSARQMELDTERATAERQAALAAEEGARTREAVGRLQAELRDRDDRLASATADVSARRAELDAERAAAERQAASAAEHAVRFRTEVEQLTAVLRDRDDELARLGEREREQRAAADAQAARDSEALIALRATLTVTRSTMREVARERDAARAAQEQLAARVAEQADALADAMSAAQSLGTELDEARVRADRASADARTCRDELATAELRLRAADDHAVALGGEATLLRERLAQAETTAGDLVAARGQIVLLEASLAEARREDAEMAARIEQARAEATAAAEAGLDALVATLEAERELATRSYIDRIGRLTAEVGSAATNGVRAHG